MSAYPRDIDPRFMPPCPEFEPIRELGRKHGYNIVEHGSRYRDYDLMAVPWTEDATSPELLLAALCDELGCFQIGTIEKKPHGRIAVTLQRDKWEKHWDLSIIAPSHPRSSITDETYVAWLRYARRGENVHIQVCASDAEGAFKVYRCNSVNSH